MSEHIRERFRNMLSNPANIQRIFDWFDHEAAFLPYWPEMLDFDLEENRRAEFEELGIYHDAFQPIGDVVRPIVERNRG